MTKVGERGEAGDSAGGCVCVAATAALQLQLLLALGWGFLGQEAVTADQ